MVTGGVSSLEATGAGGALTGAGTGLKGGGDIGALELGDFSCGGLEVPDVREVGDVADEFGRSAAFSLFCSSLGASTDGSGWFALDAVLELSGVETPQ